MMEFRRWRARLYRRMRQPARPIPPLAITLAAAVLVAAAAIYLLEWKLRPILAQVAAAQTQNAMTAVVELAVTQDLAQRQVSYSDLVTVQRDDSGSITSLTTDMAQLNLLRAELVSAILTALDGVDVADIQVPLGSLFDFELLWARGPAVKVKAMTVGTVSAEFESELTSAGVNQTLHRVWLDVEVPITILLAGGEIQVPLQTRLRVAETVIVGRVPDTYLSLDGALIP